MFVELIGRAVRQDESDSLSEPVDIHVVVTMRSEFLGECARFDGLADMINETQYLVPRMEEAALLRAVRQPAQLYGGQIDEAIAEKLIASVRGREDELPLLQHGLMMMWDETASDTNSGPIVLNLAMVERAGGLVALLSAHADDVMASVAPDARLAAIVEGALRALTNVNAEGLAIRRPVNLADLAATAGTTLEEMRKIVEAFRAPGVSFMTPYPPAPLDPATEVEISHEALIRCWRRVSDKTDGWLKQEFDDGLAWRSLLIEASAFEKDPRRTLSFAATEDRGRLFAARGEPWARRYGGGWARVGKLLEASRREAAKAKLRIAMATVALALLTHLIRDGSFSRLTSVA